MSTQTDREIVRRRNRVDREYHALLLRADALTRAVSGLTGIPETEQTDQYRETAAALMAHRQAIEVQLVEMQAELARLKAG